jgi:hypothetical protein
MFQKNLHFHGRRIGHLEMKSVVWTREKKDWAKTQQMAAA